MSEEKNTTKLKKTRGTPPLTQEEKDVLVGAFALLIKVDKRINPELYKRKK